MTLTLPIYLDNNSTTRVDPAVVDAMLPYLTENYGNAASKTHGFGRQAEEAVETAREQIASLIGATPKEIVITSGATESNNLAIKGVANMYRTQGNHIVTVRTEHKAVLDPCKRLQQNGFEVTYLPVDSDGLVSLSQLEAAITDKTILVSVMVANNEIGTIQPIADIGAMCKNRGVLFHTDAAQAAGKIPIDVDTLGIDLMSLSAHKMHGPKGIGGLYVRRRNPHVRLEPQMDGGGHERGMRSGTLPVSLVVGLGMACKICQQTMASEPPRLIALRDKLRDGLMSRLDGITQNGHPTLRLPNNLNLSFNYVRGDALLMALTNIALSSGSACTSASIEPSYVLKALGVSEELAHSSLRFGVSRFTTEEEISYTIDEVTKAVERLRAMSPDYQLAAGTLSS